MSFPTPHTVGHAVFNGTAKDRLNNVIKTWADPVDVKVIAIQPSSVENVNGYASRVVSEVDMAVPASLVVSEKDRFFLPISEHPFEVVAIENANFGFHGWQPGSIIKLKSVTG